MQACDFLEGHSREMIDALEEEMRKSGGENGFRESGGAAQHDRRFAAHDETDAPIHPPQFAEHDRSDRAMCRRWPTRCNCRKLPRVMECFDISNISTTHVVASMVCFRDGVPDKNNYRRYRIRTVEGQDDFASMAEVVRRRYSRVLLEAREANPDAAEFSQENPVGALERSDGPRVDVRTFDRPSSSPFACRI